jgi:hypothetical protein
MKSGPEDIAREQIDRMLTQAGWDVQDVEVAIGEVRRAVASRNIKREDQTPPIFRGPGLGEYSAWVTVP